jgi:ribonuclease HI
MPLNLLLRSKISLLSVNILLQLPLCGKCVSMEPLREGVGAGVVFVSPCHETISLSYKLEFETTNNFAEYEALVLGLRAPKDMRIEEITMFGDADLIV